MNAAPAQEESQRAITGRLEAKWSTKNWEHSGLGRSRKHFTLKYFLLEKTKILLSNGKQIFAVG